MRPFSTLAPALAALALLAAPAGVVQAAQADPAADQIDNFDQALLGTMKQADALGIKGRYRKLEPAVTRAFDLAAMARFSVGAATWSKFSDADQRAVVAAFTRLSVASYAHNFNGYSGERFEVDPKVDTRGPDKVVKTRLIPGQGAPVVLSYRMRATTGSWKVIDVLYQGTISQLTTRRSDLAAVSATGDAKAIAANLNAQADKLMQ
ncbi:MAG: ABC transporter substrate-binding protein [Caulobacteraceae bacterium]|nr:ABC transporter substrate-binding protein [Caulobacteraceae bacterium]